MATTTLRKMLDPTVWQGMAPAPLANAANHFTVDSEGPDQCTYLVTSTTAVYVYSPDEDAWGLLNSPALATFAAGACGRWHPTGPSGTALAGSTTSTLNTNVTILGDLTARNGLAFKVRITGGTGAGQEREIASSTLGANGIITVATNWSVTPDATSTYILYTGRVYIMGGGTTVAGSFKYWDYATQAWSGNLVVTGFPTFGTDGRMVAPNSFQSNISFTGTATGGSATTLVNSGKSWATNQFANWQVRITAGAGAGTTRLITSNTGTTLTIATGTAIDGTSVYVIEPADDYIYVAGNAAVALYRYSISGNSWSTLSPGAARGAVTGAGLSLAWVHGVTQADWSLETGVRNGNRIYSYRGGGSNVLDYYDIAANTWVSGVAYARQNELVGASGSSHEYDGGNHLYTVLPQAAAGVTRILRLEIAAPRLEGFSTIQFPAPTVATLGDKVWIAQYHDGSGEPLQFMYVLMPGGAQLFRALIW